MEKINYLLIILFFINIFYIYYKFYIVKKWILKKQKEDLKPDHHNTFYVLIPVLNEEGIIRETSTYFIKLLEKYKNSKLIFITTSKEKEKTVEIASELANSNYKIIHHHYSGDGVIAHQLNFSISKIKEFDKNYNNFIVVYNADSRPDQKTFDYVFSNDKNKNVFQQYGNYSSNIKTFPKNLILKSILLSGSGWQNRWSIIVELYRSISQFNFKPNSNSIFKPLNYCIGHGLFIRLKTLDKVNGFSESTHNEDLFLGYLLNSINETVNPIPYFDYSESPNLVSSLFFQKINWFFGPGQFYDYYKIAMKNNLFKSKIRLAILTFNVFMLVLFWLLGPLLLVYLFILLFTDFSVTYLILFLILYILFLVIPNFLSLTWISRWDKKGLDIERIPLFMYLLFGSIITYTLHGISGWLGLNRYIKQKMFGKKIEKGKTIIKR